MILEKELQLYGCETTAAEFVALLAELHHSMNRGLNEEQLLYRPERGVQFADTVRFRTGCDRLPNEVILRRLRNIQKKSKE